MPVAICLLASMPSGRGPVVTSLRSGFTDTLRLLAFNVGTLLMQFAIVAFVKERADCVSRSAIPRFAGHFRNAGKRTIIVWERPCTPVGAQQKQVGSMLFGGEV
jgi:hypothetical protein